MFHRSFMKTISFVLIVVLIVSAPLFAADDVFSRFEDAIANDDLNASTAADSVDGARDFWIADANARLADSDVVLLRERSGGQLMDAVLFAEDVQSNWKNETLTAAAAEAVATGVWQGDGTPATAAVSTGITLTRTLCRQNIPDIDFAVETGLPLPENNSGCWFVVKTSGCTPGAVNSIEMHEPK